MTVSAAYHKTRPALLTGLFLMLAGAALLSCSRSQENRTETRSGTTETQPGATGTHRVGTTGTRGVRVEEVALGREMTADRRVITTGNATFTPGDTVFASVILAGPVPATQLTARWKSADGTLVHESTQTVAPGSEGTAVLFQVVKPAGLAPGTYTLEVLADGEVVATKEFTVTAP